MTRTFKWIVGIGLVVGAIYIGLVAMTGSKMRDIAEQQLEAYNAQQQDVELRLEWHDTGFWRSTGVLHVSMEEVLQLSHTIELTHGALRARIHGEVNADVGDFNVAQQLFEDQPIRLDGRIGLGGVALSYQVPELRYDDQDLGMEYHIAPFSFDVVLRDQEQHSQVQIDWLEVSASVIGATDVMRIEGLEAGSQTRLNADDGQFERALSGFQFKRFEFSDYVDPIVVLNDGKFEVELSREQDEARLQASMLVDSYDVYGVEGDFALKLHTTPMPAAHIIAWQEQNASVEATNALLNALREYGSQLMLETLELTMGEMGDLRADGYFELREGVTFDSPQPLVPMGDHVQGQVVVHDLPLLLLMPLAGLVSAELPWTLELTDGELTINGESLQLPQ